MLNYMKQFFPTRSVMKFSYERILPQCFSILCFKLKINNKLRWTTRCRSFHWVNV